MKLIAYNLKGETRVRRGAVLGNQEIIELEGDFRELSDSQLAELARSLEGSHPGSNLTLDQVELHSPVPNPDKILCIGLNYLDHCIETNQPVPQHPILFAKYSNSLTGHDKPIVLDGTSREVDYEAELAFVIGKRAFRVSEADAMDYVAGYITANDVSGRDVQFADSQWVRGKTLNTFCPLGPWLVTKDEIADPHNLRIQCRVNGQTLQNSNTEQLIFKIPALVSFLSQGLTLEAGDIVLTGTPPGVGFTRKPKVLLNPGDVVEVEIEGVGLLKNQVVAWQE